MPKEAAAGPDWMCRLGLECLACRAPWPILDGLLAPSSWCLPVRHLISSIHMHLKYIFWPHIDSQQACTPRLQSTSLPARACVCLEYLPYIGIITVGAIAMATATFKEQRWYEADGRKVHTNNLQESVLGSVTDKRLRLQALKQITHHSACVVTRYPHKSGQRTEG